jgi:Domain of unknown function (DUF4160)
MTTNLEAPFELANLFPKHTGLPFVVWVSVRGGARHDVRVKVSPTANANPAEMVSVAIRPDVSVVEGTMSPHDLKLLTQWVDLNREPLIAYWDGMIDTRDLLDGLKTLGKES